MKRVVKETRLDPYRPCICGSGKLMRACCFSTGILRKRPPVILLPAVRTGRVQAGCYLAGTHDCDYGISGEHYMSRSVLEVLGNSVSVNGFPWQAQDERLELSIDNLTANILCGRHNSMLSPLDAEASSFFQPVYDIMTRAGPDPVVQSREIRLFSGEALEAWMLKVAAGLFYGKIASAGKRRLCDDHTFDHRAFEDAIFRSRWQAGAGLYVRGEVGLNVQGMPQVAVAPMTDTRDMTVVGALIRLAGIEFVVILRPDANFQLITGYTFRPSELHFGIGAKTSSLLLSWQHGTDGRAVHFAAGRKPDISGNSGNSGTPY